MMITATLLLGALALGPDEETVLPPVYALRVKSAETIANGAIEHAVLLVENGKITVVGEDLPVERGIPTIDKPDWIAMPGLVGCRSRIGLESRGSENFTPQLKASAELYPRQSAYADLLEAGVTTLGLVPAGEGVVGQAVAVRTQGATAQEVVLKDPAYLLVVLRSNAKSKGFVMQGFAKADEHEEKVAKAREKWEKDQEKKKKSKKDDEKKEDEKKEGEKKEEAKKDDEKKDEDGFEPPAADPETQPFLDLRSGALSALFDLSKAADFLHLLDALGDEEIPMSVFWGLRDDIDVYEVADKLGERKLRAVLTPDVTLQPFTRRDRNIPAELVAAGAKLALVPRSDSTAAYRAWRLDVANLVRFGLSRDAALRAITLEPAEVLGVADRVGSLEAGKDANLILLDGDPFEAGTRVRMVILEGKNVYEYEAPTTGGDA